MPLYEYKCQECGHSYERIERASEPKDGTCPDCGAVAHRLIGNPALQFKGSGWYVNDYGKGKGKGKGNGNGSRPTEKETETATKAANEGTSTSKTEKKTSEKTEKKSDAKVA